MYPVSNEDLIVRQIVEESVKSGEPFRPHRPDWLPSISLMVLARDEWETIEESICSWIPLITEVVIGLDTLTDSPQAIAHKILCEEMPEVAETLFLEATKNKRRATIAEIADCLNMSEIDLNFHIEKYGKPSREAAQKAIDAVGSGRIVDIEFNENFSASRNELIGYCTGEWIAFSDAHEFLDSAPKLASGWKAALEQVPEFVRMGIIIDMFDGPMREQPRQTRLWKNGIGAKFERAVHNRLVIPPEYSEEEPVIEGITLVHNRPRWLHLFRDPQRQTMIEEHMGNPDDPACLYYSGTAAHRSERYDEALQYYEKYVMKAPDGIEKAVIYSYMARIYHGVLHNYHMADAMYRNGLRVAPDAAFCWLGMAHALMDKDTSCLLTEKEKKAGLELALKYTEMAAGCVYPASNIAIPAPAYTWDAYIKKAEILNRMNRLNEAIEALQTALTFEMPNQLRLDTEEAVRSGLAHLQAKLYDSSHKVTADKPILYILDKTEQFSYDIEDIANELGFVVLRDTQYNPKRGFMADFIWCDWSDENAILASHSKNNKQTRLAVRTHSYETFTDMPDHIHWGNVDYVICDSEHLRRKLGRGGQIITVIPNYRKFNRVSDPENPDVCFLKRINYKSGAEYITDLAKLLPDRMFHVAGHIQDERLFDHMCYRIYTEKLSNVKIYGTIDESNKEDFFRLGGRFVCLSPFEGNPVAPREAMLYGQHVFMLNSQWKYIFGDRIVVGDGLQDLADKISEKHRYYQDWRGSVIEERTAMEEEIKNVLLGT